MITASLIFTSLLALSASARPSMRRATCPGGQTTANAAVSCFPPVFVKFFIPTLLFQCCVWFDVLPDVQEL